MTYKVYLNANDGAYSDVIGTFNNIESARESANDVILNKLSNFDPSRDYISIGTLDEDGELVDDEVL